VIKSAWKAKLLTGTSLVILGALVIKVYPVVLAGSVVIAIMAIPEMIKKDTN